MSEENTHSKPRVHVTLDLGSESMAAFYDDPANGTSGMIKLQAQAKDLLTGSGANLAEIEYLEDKNENGDQPTKSARLWNRISYRDGKQPPELPEDHAKLQFSSQGNYE